MLIEDSLTAILRSIQMLASIRTVSEEAERAAMFGVPRSFLHGPFEIVRPELEHLASLPRYRDRFGAIFEQVMSLCCDRINPAVFGSKSTLNEHWEDLTYLRSVLADLRILLIVRNPINVIASSLRRRDNARAGRDVWHINSVEEAAAEWKAAMQTMARVSRDQSSPTLVVKYEALCSDGEIVERLFKFLGLEPFTRYPGLWPRQLQETRLTLSAVEAAFLEDVFPGVDELWQNSGSDDLLNHFSGD